MEVAGQDVSVGEAVQRPRVMSRWCMAGPRCFGTVKVRDQVHLRMLGLYNRDECRDHVSRRQDSTESNDTG